MDIDASELKKITEAIADVAKGRRQHVHWRGEHKQLGLLVRAINRVLRAREAMPAPGLRPVVWSDPLSTHTLEDGEFCQSCVTPVAKKRSSRRPLR